MMDFVLYLHFDAQGDGTLLNTETLREGLSYTQIDLLRRSCNEACRWIKQEDPAFAQTLCSRRLQLRLCENSPEPVAVTPHEILVQADLLIVSPEGQTRRLLFLVGLLEKAFYQWCHGEVHASVVAHHSLCFLNRHTELYQAALEEWKDHYSIPVAPLWLRTLEQATVLLALERFWAWFARQRDMADLPRTSEKRALLALIAGAAERYVQETPTSSLSVEQLSQCRLLTVLPESLVIVYDLGVDLHKVIRVGPSALQDAMTTPAACFSHHVQSTRMDIYYDHSVYIRPWLLHLEAYERDPSLLQLAGQLLSDNIPVVTKAVDTLVAKLQQNDEWEASLRLLYATLYYWEHPDKGACRQIALRVSKHLEDLLTERPAHFPPTQTQRSVFAGEPTVLTVQIQRPVQKQPELLQVRVLWSLDGQAQQPIPLIREVEEGPTRMLRFTGTLPVERGWFHYATEVSLDGGGSWSFETADPAAQGLVRLVADERGQRVLSCYADTFNLRLNRCHEPERDQFGAYVYGSFDTIASQLEAIRAEGYTRIYPLGALELGWAGEAGPDPSVFSIWDGCSVRRDLGGLPALLRCRDKAASLGMKIVLCVVSHFARALNNHPYHLPVYIQEADGRLARRAGWDGEGSEWLDSFMVNMRDYASVLYLAHMAAELTAQGFGLRIDVGHGFDTVFPVDPQTHTEARLMGEVCKPGFETVDLRGSWQANLALLTLCYRAQKASPEPPVIYAEQWHGNETRMLLSGATPYNSLIKNLEHIRSGAGVTDGMGLNENLRYLQDLLARHGGQTLSLFNSHDEESPTSNYQNMIWPVAAFLVFSSYGPVAYHISRLPGEEIGSVRERFDLAYLECWKHWVNNRFSHPWANEENARQTVLARYPLLKGFGPYLRSLFQFVDAHPALSRGSLVPLDTQHGRIAAFVRSLENRKFLCVFNFPDTHADRQDAVTRSFNFALKEAGSGKPLGDIVAEGFYCIQERYNNVEGQRRRGFREMWFGAELLHLGFGGVLAPVSSHVYEVAYCGVEASQTQTALIDSFRRYFRYGKEDRVRHTYVASVFRETCECRQGGFKRFAARFTEMVAWIRSTHKRGVADLATLLSEVTEYHSTARTRVVDYLTRMAVRRQGDLAYEVQEAAADVLHALQIGTIVMVSPESRFSGSSGGVGLYTTDIADVLSEMGFQVVVVTPLYEQNRQQIWEQFSPRYEGQSCTIRFPMYDEAHETIGTEPDADTVNFLRAKLNRVRHGKRSRVEVLYLENAKYFNRPYGGEGAEDKLRRARLFAEGAIEALRCYNYYPSVIQTNEWPTWLVAGFLARRRAYRNDPHFARTQAFSMMHNPHPAHSIVLKETHARKACYYVRVLGFDPIDDFDVVFHPDSDLEYIIDLTHIMLKTSPSIGTVSQAMRQRILDETWLFGNARLFQEKAAQGRFFSRRNGFNMAARQRFWFGSKQSLLETSQRSEVRSLYHRYTKTKRHAKQLLQQDPHLHLFHDSDRREYVIFGMLHRICRQKGFELLVDWKVRQGPRGPQVVHDACDMGGETVLEHFLASDPRIQFVICGRVEDSFDGRRYHMHLERIAHHPNFQGRFAYYPQGDLPTSLYRNLYIGSQYFVMPSGGDIGEPCGISQQEAHAGGTPVIAHHQDGLKQTVCDRDFGDVGHPPNGIKFDGFRGDRLLEALLDAVEIYFKGRRRNYKDRQGHPRSLLYSDLSFNAFSTDHRWLRLLRDYVRMYARMLNTSLPPHLDAIQLIVDIHRPDQKHPGDAVLKRGLTIDEAREKLTEACKSPNAALSHAAKHALERLHALNNVRKKSGPRYVPSVG